MPNPLLDFDWDKHIREGQQGVQAIQKMPHVFSDYGSLGGMSGPEIKQTFYGSQSSNGGIFGPSNAEIMANPQVKAYLQERPDLVAYYQAHPEDLQKLIPWLQSQGTGNPVLRG